MQSCCCNEIKRQQLLKKHEEGWHEDELEQRIKRKRALNDS